jgi:hypothetical protein
MLGKSIGVAMGKLETPVDEMSGLPLLMVPHEDVLPILWGLEKAHTPEGRQIADWNHVWHPARVVTNAGKGGPGLRESRTQYVMRAEHDEYHAQYDGPPLPQKPSERFEAMVLCAAGYIPPEAMSFASNKPKIVKLNDWERTRLRESGEVRVASFKIVQSFMREYVIGQPIDHIKDQTIDRFLRVDPKESADAAKEHKYLAHLLLSLVIDQVEHTIAEPYMHGHQTGLLAREAPPRVDQFILGSVLLTKRNLNEVSQDFRKKLVKHRQLEQRTGGLAIHDSLRQ